MHNNTNHTPPPVITPQMIQQHVAPFYDLSHIKDGGSQGVTITGKELITASQGEHIAFLIDSLMQRVGLACLAGSSDTGKSCVLRQLAIAIASGADEFLGFRLNPLHRQAIYVATEDGKEATTFLLKRQSKSYHPDALEGLRFIFDDENLYSELDHALSVRAADVVIIDCFQDVYGDDLKDSQKIRSFLHSYQLLAEKHQCLFLFLHHTGKRTENFEPNKNNLLSGQGFEAKMRLVIELRADLMHPAQRHLCIVKGNYLPASIKKESHVLQFDEANFTFSSTGDRMPFELLVKQENKTGNEASKAKFLHAKELKKQGLNYQQIATKMGYNSKGSISRLFEKAKQEGWDTENENNAPEEAEETNV